jgi:AAA ATPase domain
VRSKTYIPIILILNQFKRYMPHLKHIGLTNFRVFGERTDIALAPLTILTGTNSSGKSSVLKAMQLLQENIADIGFLNFSDGEHKLGDFYMALNRDATDETIVFTLPFEYEGMTDRMYMDWIYNVDTSNDLQNGKLMRVSVCLKKNGHEVIGITPCDKIDIDLDYFRNLRGSMNFWINVSETSIWQNIEKRFYHVSELYRNIEDNLDNPSDDNILNSIRRLSIGIEKEKDREIFDKYKTKKELLTYVIKLLESVKEKLKLEYPFENDKELSVLMETTFFEVEKIYYESFQSGIQSTKKHYNNQGDEFNLDALIDYLPMENYLDMMHINHFFIFNKEKEQNIITRFLQLVRNEGSLNIEIETSIFGGDKKSKPLITDIYSTVAKILQEGFKKYRKGTLKAFQKDNLYFLEAVRANTQRIYTWQSQGTTFNQLLLELVKSCKQWQIDFIEHWLKEFGIGNELKFKLNEHGIGASITIDDRPLADLGYGVTQFLPILIKLVTIVKYKYCPPDPWSENGWAFYDKKILYIEEPETNLHPKLQSKLADMFVDACQKFNLQIIVETHSEYLIRKLQYLTAKKEITPQMTVIHYFYDPKEERPEGEPQVKQINIQTDGRLTGQFGAGFYDETARLMTAILTGETLN